MLHNLHNLKFALGWQWRGGTEDRQVWQAACWWRWRAGSLQAPAALYRAPSRLQVSSNRRTNNVCAKLPISEPQFPRSTEMLDINPWQKEMHFTPSGIDCSLLNAEPEKPSPAPTLRKNLVPFFMESCDLAASCLFKFQSLSMHELQACVALRKQIMQMKNEARTNQIRKAKSFRLYNQIIYTT